MDKQIHKQNEIYDNEEDRRNGLLAAKRRYANQPWFCITCNIVISRGGKTNHDNSVRHRQNLENLRN
jgi:hypothetical protein